MSNDTKLFLRSLLEKVLTAILVTYLAVWGVLKYSFEGLYSVEALKASAAAGVLALLNGLLTRLKGDPNTGHWRS